MKEIKKIGVLSLGKISALFGILFGFFVGLSYWQMGYSGNIPPFLSELPPALFSPWAILFMPIFYCIVYFLGGMAVALLYNLFAKWVGGFKINI